MIKIMRLASGTMTGTTVDINILHCATQQVQPREFSVVDMRLLFVAAMLCLGKHILLTVILS